jgi:hypothetical protein
MKDASYSYDDVISSIKDIKTCLKPSLIEGAGVGVFALRDNIKSR